VSRFRQKATRESCPIAVFARRVVRLAHSPARVLVLARVKLRGASGTAYGCLGQVLGAKPSRQVVVGRSVLALVAQQFGWTDPKRKTDRTEPRRKRLLKPFLVSLRCLKKQQHEPSTRSEQVGFVPVVQKAGLRVRGLERVQLHADLVMLARLSSALSRARAVSLAA
jgi:hypothetical protein